MAYIIELFYRNAPIVVRYKFDGSYELESTKEFTFSKLLEFSSTN